MCEECISTTYSLARNHGVSRNEAFDLARSFNRKVELASTEKTYTSTSSSTSSSYKTSYPEYDTYTAEPGNMNPPPRSSHRSHNERYDVPPHTTGGSRSRQEHRAYYGRTHPMDFDSRYDAYGSRNPSSTPPPRYESDGEAPFVYTYAYPGYSSYSPVYDSDSDIPKSKSKSKSKSHSKPHHHYKSSSSSSSSSRPKPPPTSNPYTSFDVPPPPHSNNLYKILGLPKSASPESIKKAYRTLSLKNHPDRVGSAATSIMAEINHAYDVLGDEGKRKMYDLYGVE